MFSWMCSTYLRNDSWVKTFHKMVQFYVWVENSKDDDSADCPRRRSRINTNWFSQMSAKGTNFKPGPGAGSLSKFFGFLLPKVPFPGFPSHSDRISSWKVFLLFKIYNYSLWKMWPISLKQWKTGVDPCLSPQPFAHNITKIIYHKTAIWWEY